MHKIIVPLNSGGFCILTRDDKWELPNFHFVDDVLEPLMHLRRFAGQLGDYTVGCHLLFGCQFLASIGQKAAIPSWITHESAEALGLGDVHHQWKKVFCTSAHDAERELCKLIQKQVFPKSVPAGIEGLDRWLGWLEARQLMRTTQWKLVREHVEPPPSYHNRDQLEVFFTKVWHQLPKNVGQIQNALIGFLRD